MSLRNQLYLQGKKRSHMNAWKLGMLHKLLIEISFPLICEHIEHKQDQHTKKNDSVYFSD